MLAEVALGKLINLSPQYFIINNDAFQIICRNGFLLVFAFINNPPQSSRIMIRIQPSWIFNASSCLIGSRPWLWIITSVMTFIIFRGTWQVPKRVHKTYNIQNRSGAKVSNTPAQPKCLKNTLSPKTPFTPLTTDGYHNTEKCCARIRKDLWLWAV